ncbi:MAG: lipid A biosynthesis acyltransferase [Burkholderiaceae bacterium]
MGARILLAALWLLHGLPLAVLAPLGRGLGLILYAVVGARRRVVLRNLAMCLPHLNPAERHRLAREHFQWLGRSIIERGLLWYAPPQRLKRLIRVEGDVHLAQRSERAVMWLVPHFMALDVAGAATQLFQSKWVASIYQQQSDAIMDAAIRRGRLRFNQGEVFARSDSARPLLRAIRSGAAFFNLPDMDFGARDAAFVPFFDILAATLLAPSRMARAMNMVVQPVIAKMLPGSQGYVVHFLEPWSDFPSADPLADTARLNRWIEAQIRADPAQYLWVHKRFKTRPPGEAPFYASD